MLNSGERQVSDSIDGIRRDHVARYEFAAQYINERTVSGHNPQVIDYACGIGYGAKLLADSGAIVDAYDIDRETIKYARDHYADAGIAYHDSNGNEPGALNKADWAVCYETIEHIQNPEHLLKVLRLSANWLIASVPNENVMPYEISPGVVYEFHHRHYTKNQFHDLLAQCGWHVIEWYGQEGTESDVERDCYGRTLIAVCEKSEIPLPDQQKHISILGLGPSLDQYVEITKRLGGRHKFCDETWTINALGNIFDSDLIFHMDDIRIQEIRAKALPDSNIAALVGWIKDSKTPIMTSRSHGDYPALIEFPLEDVLNNLGHDYFNNTGAYAVAFAIYAGATKISLFGMDYTYPNAHDAEKGRACVEFWLGQAHARGIKINLPKTTTLMDSMYPRASRLYGYDTVDIAFQENDNGFLKLVFTEKETLPTAEEIEKSYDHSAPIHDQHIRD